MLLNDFVKFYPLRSKNIIWFLGAGASVSAGIPTAYDMIWDFKRTIFCADNKLPVSSYANLSNPAIRRQIQLYFNNQKNVPIYDSAEEYSYYFERAYSNLIDRSNYIARMVSTIRPSFGHKIMATLMRMGELNYTFTTNFDKAIENIAAQTFQNVDALHIASIENSASALRFLQEGKKPLLIKLHGDYHSQFLKNTKTELQQQDAILRVSLKEACLRFGFAFMGYSGRDTSIMEVLEEAIQTKTAFPQGLFWFVKSGSIPLKRVNNLIETAKKQGIQADIVEAETFDETFSDIIKSFSNIPHDLKQNLYINHQKIISRPIPFTGKRFPVIRLNALRIIEYPTVARLVECSIGNTKEVKQVVEQTKANVLVIRKKEGVIGFGDDKELEKAFENYDIRNKGIYSISDHLLSYDESSIKELLTLALLKALVNGKPLRYSKRGSNYYILLDPKQLNHTDCQPLKELRYHVYGKEVNHQVVGIIPQTELTWVDAVKINLAFHFSTLYLIINPTIIVQRSDDTRAKSKIAPFINEHLAGRLNSPSNSILDAWITILLNGKEEANLSSFGGVNGIDATFKIRRKTAYSKLT